MHRALRILGVILVFIVPAGTVALIVAFPDLLRWMPLWFWVGWLLISLVASLEAPMLADYFSPPRRGMHGAIRWTKRCVALGLLNLAAAVAALIYLMMARPTG